ncbi:MAG: hypothetical protein Q7T16_03535 [Candidatus Burarchaeum sp.]|nr:hypothetical protein [Candidatus Burarchaeum sp.]MDO8339703.1 hypothetical protein [Candidatus Burarchaeum sp.]
MAEKDLYLLLAAAFLFAAVAVLTYPLASNSIIISPTGSGEFMLGSYYFSHFEPLTADQKQLYGYFNIHRPLIVLMMVGVHWLGLANVWFLLPFAFYILSGVFLYLFLKNKIENQIVLLSAVLLLLFNSVYLYFGLHLLPDIPFAASLIAMLYFLDKAVKLDGAFSETYWRLALIAALAAMLMRMEGFLALLIPLFYYAYAKWGGDVAGWPRKALADRNVREYVLMSIVAVSLCFTLLLFLTERTLDVWNYPARMAEYIPKLSGDISNVGANKGSPDYILSETILGFTILPFIFSLLGLGLALSRREKALYPCAALLIGLFIMNSLMTFFSHGEQRYVTHLFPMLTVFAAYAVDRVVKKVPLKGEYARGAIAVLLMALLVYSSYFLVHKGLGKDNEILGYSSKKMTVSVTTEATEGFEWDRNFSAMIGYFYVQEAIRNYEGSYSRIFVTFDPTGFAEYVPMMYKKNVYGMSVSELWRLTGNDIAIILTNQTVPEGAPYTKHLFYPEYGRHLYILTKKDVEA